MLAHPIALWTHSKIQTGLIPDGRKCKGAGFSWMLEESGARRINTLTSFSRPDVCCSYLAAKIAITILAGPVVTPLHAPCVTEMPDRNAHTAVCKTAVEHVHSMTNKVTVDLIEVSDSKAAAP